MDFGSLAIGGLIGVVAEQIVMYLINKGHVERAIEQAEKIIPDQYEPLIAKLLDEASKELKDQDGGD